MYRNISKFWFKVFTALMTCFLPVLIKAETPVYLTLTANVNIYTAAVPGDPLYKAVSALQRDINKMLPGHCAIRQLSEITTTGIVVLNATDNLNIKPVSGWEAHYVHTGLINHREHVILQGADMRGTIYAIYTFSEKVLGIPPLWYYSGWQPRKVKEVKVPLTLHYYCSPPQVKYRGWFPNDTDLFAPWRKLSHDNDVMWLETALRLKLNMIEWFDDEFDYSKKYSVSPTTRLISEYGLIYTTHHHSPLNASLSGWKSYWKNTRDTVPPLLSLANVDKLEEFWRYNVECIVRNKINMLWVIGFRADGDHPFWYTFKDAPQPMNERGQVISEMMQRQKNIVTNASKNPDIQFRTIFYDELSDLLSQGYIHPPADTSLIWTFVAARRDHYPNKDIQQLDKSRNLNLGYYFNYQFTSTGSHLAAGEGPWKMEQNFRYISGKSGKPLALSVVNAGNIREFLMELSANAAMMWNFKTYDSDAFIKDYCALYFGGTSAVKAAVLYKNYYNSYWKQKRPDLDGFDRQYIFQDLRYKRAIMDICNAFKRPYDPNPLKDNTTEQEQGRTFRIVPQDNAASSQIDAIINGTTKSAKDFFEVARQGDVLSPSISANGSFFHDNLIAPSYYMYNLNTCLLQLCKAYQENNKESRHALIRQSIAALKNAELSLLKTQHGDFLQWYAGDKVVGFKGLYAILNTLNDDL